jgi:hypothetical protein
VGDGLADERVGVRHSGAIVILAVMRGSRFP